MEDVILQVNHLSKSFGSHEVLRDIDFTVAKGDVTSIIGASGSGKSTLLRCINLLETPTSGRITIGGVDIRKMKRESLRRQIGLVLQEPFLFSQTIRENISATKPQATEEELRRAAAIACVDEAITEFPDGYETVVGERGVTLSGGQKQRVAIARMLVQQAPIMVFDDSLSAVDAQTDAKIRAALRESLDKSTVILISHRITTLMQADRILVLDRGRIAEQGSYEELMEKKGLFYELANRQLS